MRLCCRACCTTAASVGRRGVFSIDRRRWARLAMQTPYWKTSAMDVVRRGDGHSDFQLVTACDLTNLNTLVNRNLGIGTVSSRSGQPTPAGSGLLTGNSGVKIAIDN